MRRHHVGDLVYYTFDSLRNSGAVIHAISTRHGGVSPAPFATLNLSRFIGDDEKNVTINLERLHAALALDATTTVEASQAQADRVALVDSRHRGTRISEVDALLTNAPGIPLLLRYADCVPIFFFDPIQRAVGIAHAGWRGTVMQIVAKTARTMFDAFGTRPRDLTAYLAPSIGPCCYRVDADVIARVRAAFDDADALLIAQPDGTHFDLWQANAQQLSALGIEQIEIAQVCTAHHTEDWYSWRAERGKTGRFEAIIAIPNSEF
jgi:YfiH family protein